MVQTSSRDQPQPTSSPGFVEEEAAAGAEERDDDTGDPMTEPEPKMARVPSVKAGMLICRPPEEVFAAFVDPAITTTFWFTKSSGRLEPGAEVEWEWEMYDVFTRVRVKEFEHAWRVIFDWGPDEDPTTVEFRFVRWEDETTYVEVTETGLSGDGDTATAHAVDSTGGFSQVLCAAKALLEHDVVLTVVRDHRPKGLEL